MFILYIINNNTPVRGQYANSPSTVELFKSIQILCFSGFRFVGFLFSLQNPYNLNADSKHEFYKQK